MSFQGQTIKAKVTRAALNCGHCTPAARNRDPACISLLCFKTRKLCRPSPTYLCSCPPDLRFFDYSFLL